MRSTILRGCIDRKICREKGKQWLAVLRLSATLNKGKGTMRAWVCAAVAILSASVALAGVAGEATGNSSASSGATSSNQGSHGGVGHAGEVSHPTEVSSGPPIPPGGSQSAAGGIRPGVSNLRSYPASDRLGQRPTTIQIRPGVSRWNFSPRSRLAQSNFTGQRSQTSATDRARARPQRGSTSKSVITTRDGRPHEGNWSRHDPANKSRFDRQTQDRLRNWQGKKPDFAEACRRHDDHCHHHHPRDWWRHHCNAVVLVDWGFWGWSNGWWYPAWGYDAYYSSYEYDGPIYGYDGLLPDEIVANVQNELQRLGYFPYEIDGVFGPLTQEAMARYQSDHGFPVTGAIDPQTLTALGLL